MTRPAEARRPEVLRGRDPAGGKRAGQGEREGEDAQPHEPCPLAPAAVAERCAARISSRRASRFV